MYRKVYTNKLPYLFLSKKAVKGDPWIYRNGNNGRKVLVNEIRPSTERPIRSPQWRLGGKRSPVLEVGCGGVEVATFTHNSKQDCHKHLICTEIYTVLEGEMIIRLNQRKNQTLTLEQGDELVVLPGTPHEVCRDTTEFLTRVHSIDCHGDNDKYIKVNGNWRLATT